MISLIKGSPLDAQAGKGICVTFFPIATPLYMNYFKIIFRRAASTCTTLHVTCKTSSMPSRGLICQNHSFIYFPSKQDKICRTTITWQSSYCAQSDVHLRNCIYYYVIKCYLRDVCLTSSLCKAMVNEKVWSLKEIVNLSYDLDFGCQKAWLNLPTSRSQNPSDHSDSERCELRILIGASL